MLAQLQGPAVQFVYSEADLVSHPTAPCCQIHLKTGRSLASLARSPELGSITDVAASIEHVA
jgi:hypothetical protein